MKYLVTGGAGFIGSHIVERLLVMGEQVRVVDNFLTGRRSNIEPFLDGIELIEGDLAEPEIAERSVAGVDFVLHQAALPSVPRSVADPLASHHHCVSSTVALLEACRKAKVKRFVQASSSSVYGDQAQLPKCEQQFPSPRSPYAAAKLACEGYALAFSQLYGLSAVSLRYFNVFGPRQDPSSAYAAVVPAFVTALLSGEQPVVYGDGQQSRDFTFVANVVDANIQAATCSNLLSGEVVNVACGQSYSVLKLLELISEITGKEIEPRFIPPQPGDVRESQADITLAGKLFDYQPTVDFQEGLRRTVQSFQSQAQ
jgi:UDP-N-acetylglucosamine/UDP-N-acetyl-alpha-D-glucosaminouronate 4-epimerase